VLSDFRSFLSTGIRNPGRQEYLRFAAMPQDQREVALRLAIQSVSIGNEASFAHSPIDPS
jgi:hypothetical protein